MGTVGAGAPARELAIDGKRNGLRCTVVEARGAVTVSSPGANRAGAASVRFSTRVAGLAIGGTVADRCCCTNTIESWSGGRGKGPVSGSPGSEGGLSLRVRVSVSVSGSNIARVGVGFLILPRITTGLGGTIGSCCCIG